MFIFGGFPDLDAIWFWPGIPRYLPQGLHLKPCFQPLHRHYLPSYKGRGELSWSDSSMDTGCSVQWSTELVTLESWSRQRDSPGFPEFPTHDHLGLPFPGWRMEQADQGFLPSELGIHVYMHVYRCVCVRVKVLSLFRVLKWPQEILGHLRSTQLSKWFLRLQKWLPELVLPCKAVCLLCIIDICSSLFPSHRWTPLPRPHSTWQQRLCLFHFHTPCLLLAHPLHTQVHSTTSILTNT